MLTGLVLMLLPTAVAQDGGVVVMGGKPDFYVIQTGDTLWDISTRFLGDAYAWPELWSVNEYITNPHWIYPGNRIYFTLGSQLSPPSAGVNEPTSTAYVEPQPVQEAAEVACDFPPRFQGDYDDVSVTAPGVIAFEDDLGIRGDVYGADEPGQMLGETSIVYLRMDDVDGIDCGDLLGIWRQQSKKKIRGLDRQILGRQYRVLGIVQVLRVDDNTVTAAIRDSYSEIARGDLVGDPLSVEVTIDVREPDDELQATIIARLTDEQFLANTGETVFLDHGTNDGVDVGQALYIVERRDAQDIDTKEDELLPERVVGRVVVVRAEPEFSTAVVVNAARDVQPGLRVSTVPNAR